MATEAREPEERGHSARYLILIFLVCVATCGVFFSLGFLVGFNERGIHLAPTTEVVTPPPLIPPTVNPPPDGGQITPQTPPSGQATPLSTPETEVIPPGRAGANHVSPAAKPTEVAPPAMPAPAAAKPASTAPAAGKVGEGITLQVAALRTRQDAEHLVEILKGRGYPVFLVTPEYAHADDNLFRVQVGPFKTHDDATQVQNKLTQEGFKPFVKH